MCAQGRFVVTAVVDAALLHILVSPMPQGGYCPGEMIDYYIKHVDVIIILRRQMIVARRQTLRVTRARMRRLPSSSSLIDMH